MTSGFKAIITAVSSTVILRGISASIKAKKALSENNLPKSFTITAHTGCEGTNDNSLQAIKTGFDCGADIVEFDVNFLSDGTPVLSHDKPKGECVLVEDAFALIKTLPHLKVNLDLKTTDNIAYVYSLALKHGITDRIFYTGVEKKDVKTVKEKTPYVEYFLNTETKKSKTNNDKYIQSLIDEVKASGAVGINMHYPGVTQKLVKAFHNEGLLVSAWTVSTEARLYKMAYAGVDNITTRTPAKAVELLK